MWATLPKLISKFNVILKIINIHRVIFFFVTRKANFYHGVRNTQERVARKILPRMSNEHTPRGGKALDEGLTAGRSGMDGVLPTAQQNRLAQGGSDSNTGGI